MDYMPLAVLGWTCFALSWAFHLFYYAGYRSFLRIYKKHGEEMSQIFKDADEARIRFALRLEDRSEKGSRSIIPLNSKEVTTIEAIDRLESLRSMLLEYDFTNPLFDVYAKVTPGGDLFLRLKAGYLGLEEYEGEEAIGFSSITRRRIKEVEILTLLDPRHKEMYEKVLVKSKKN